MLYISLVISLVLLVVVNRIVARLRHPVLGTIVCCLGCTLGPGCVMLYFPAVAWQAGLMCVSLPILLVPRRGKRLYLPLSCVATLVAYGILLHSAVEKRRSVAQLREQYPFESLEERLPVRPDRESSPPTHPGRLDRLESEIEQQSEPWWYNARAANLEQLHKNSVDDFVNSAGFGVGRVRRMRPPTDAESLKSGLQDNPPVPQPDYLSPFVHPAGDLTTRPPDWDAPKLSLLHDAGVLDFVNPKGFGFIKDRRHVAGFQKHGMTKVPEASAPWAVARVELVGLLLHDSPAAYVSANLPRMDELRAAPTRPLDAFEVEALESLRHGEDLFARGADDKARMVGAIRATKQCLGCHGGARGDLLGAFSYGLRRDTPRPR
ncbi:MAG: hypothetical protein JWO38_7413 [Gemmataceae bacterium]|nr:hypothetical protein [Gemmataceae bacterium]